jgi:hypothetical protein
MSRQLDAESEDRYRKRIEALVRALEGGIPEALSDHGAELLGLSLKYDAHNCLLTVRADRAGLHSVCFIGSDSIINCFLKLQSEASRDSLRWKADQYHRSDT